MAWHGSLKMKREVLEAPSAVPTLSMYFGEAIERFENEMKSSKANVK
jgi:hypothetical protein